jgi:T4-like virus Myoviridae tail sheath stabiliser
MLSDIHFYHRITRKIVVSFGSLFNNLKLYRYNKAGTTEIERITVPLTYAPKEKFYSRTTQDPELTKEVQMTLPRMSFEMNSITYDPLRKVSSFTKQFAANSNTAVKSVATAPYNFDFTLNIYVRNTEDGTQLVEQILPYFSPDYTVTIDLIGEDSLKVDVPIVLNSINYEVDAMGGPDDLRVLVWTLTFTAKAYLYGPISNSKIIRTAIANTYYDTEISAGVKRFGLTSGYGNYKTGELVYEGRSLEGANATAFVQSWDPVSNTILIDSISGIFDENRKLRGAITGTTYTIQTMNYSPYQVSRLVVTPDPITANANTDFGFTETFTEYITAMNLESGGVVSTDSTTITSDSTSLTADIS